MEIIFKRPRMRKAETYTVTDTSAITYAVVTQGDVVVYDSRTHVPVAETADMAQLPADVVETLMNATPEEAAAITEAAQQQIAQLTELLTDEVEESETANLPVPANDEDAVQGREGVVHALARGEHRLSHSSANKWMNLADANSYRDTNLDLEPSVRAALAAICKPAEGNKGGGSNTRTRTRTAHPHTQGRDAQGGRQHARHRGGVGQAGAVRWPRWRRSPTTGRAAW